MQLIPVHANDRGFCISYYNITNVYLQLCGEMTCRHATNALLAFYYEITQRMQMFDKQFQLVILSICTRTLHLLIMLAHVFIELSDPLVAFCHLLIGD